MKRTFENDSKVSLNRFNKIIKNVLEKMLSSKVTSLEEYTIKDSHDSEEVLKAFIKNLDIYSGIDTFRFHDIHGFQFIASRIQTIQNGFKPYNTFTIRYKRPNTKTEYEKRMYQIENDWLYPTITLQAYVNENDKLISMGVVKTKDMFMYVSKNLSSFKEVENKDNSSSFLIIPFNELHSCKFMFYESESEDSYFLFNSGNKEEKPLKY